MNDPFRQATADILTAVGVSATYKPKSGAEVSTSVAFGSDIEVGGTAARLAEDSVVLSCNRDEVGIPTRGDVFTIDGTDYTVDAIPEDEAGDEYLVRVIVHA